MKCHQLIENRLNQNIILYFLTALAIFSTFLGLPGWTANLKAADPIIVNINNPNFRKLVISVPKFTTINDASSGLQDLSEKGTKELSRLLEFSGIFNLMAETAFKDLSDKKLSTKIGLSESPKGLEGVDLQQWKALGTDSLIIGEMEEEKDNLFGLSIRAIDINRGELVLGKRFKKIKKDDLNLVIRRFADQLLSAYTGKTGIFSSKIVFIGRESKGANKQVFICDFDGSNLKKISKKNTTHLSPAWSPDGRFISYTSYEDGNPDLFIYDVSTGQAQKLSGKPGINSGSAWAPSGNLIAFTGSSNGDADIFTITPKGRKTQLLIRGNGIDVDPQFSPNGEWLAFVSGRFGNPHIFKATLKWISDSHVQVVNDLRLTYAGWYNTTPAWSPDSAKIAFAGYDRTIDRWDIFIVDPDGKKLERLTIRAGDNEKPSWSPNGQLIVFQSNRIKGKDEKGIAQLYIMNRDGSDQKLFFTGLYEAQTPAWGHQPGEEKP